MFPPRARSPPSQERTQGLRLPEHGSHHEVDASLGTRAIPRHQRGGRQPHGLGSAHTQRDSAFHFRELPPGPGGLRRGRRPLRDCGLYAAGSNAFWVQHVL